MENHTTTNKIKRRSKKRYPLIFIDESTGIHEIINDIGNKNWRKNRKMNMEKAKRKINGIKYKKTIVYEKKVVGKNNENDKSILYEMFSKFGKYIGKISLFGLKYLYSEKYNIERNEKTLVAIVDIDNINDFCYDANNREFTPSYNINIEHCVLCNCHKSELIKYDIMHKEHKLLFGSKYLYCNKFSVVSVCVNCDPHFLSLINSHYNEIVNYVESKFPKQQIVKINRRIDYIYTHRKKITDSLIKYGKYRTLEEICSMQKDFDTSINDVKKNIDELKNYGIYISDDYTEIYLNSLGREKNLYCYDKFITNLFPTQLHYFDFCRKTFIKHCPIKYLSKHLTHGFNDLE